MLKDKVRKDPGAAKKRGYQLVEMSDGTLRVRSGWAYAYILPAIVSFPVIHLAEQKSPHYTASFYATDLSSTARS